MQRLISLLGYDLNFDVNAIRRMCKISEFISLDMVDALSSLACL